MPPVEMESAEDVTAEVEADALDPLVGLTLDGRFRIVDVIGKGAMGKVYRAVQLPLNRAVALKVLDSRYGAGREESFRQRFLVEAALTAKLSHPNTVRVLDYGSTRDGLFYLAMEFLDGESMDKLLARGALPWRRVLNLGQQVARALKEAHDLGVVHRDLKPGNIVLLNAGDDTDYAKVLDFGLVKSFVEGQELEGRAITQQGMLMGSPPYMAPEQGEQNRADPRSDIYSLGIVLFEALAGQQPFRGGAPLEIILKHVHEKVPPLAAPPGFEAIPEGFSALVTKCLAKSPMDRFQSMDEVLSGLQDVAPATLTPAVEMPSLEVPVVRPRSSVVLVLGFALAMAVGVGGTLLILKRPQPAPSPPETTEARVETPPQPEREATPPPAPASILFHIESIPSGATVSLKGKVVGVTPMNVERIAGPGRTTLEVTLSKDGFVPLTASAGGTGGRVELVQKLQPVPPVVAKPVVVKESPRPRPPRAEKKQPKPPPPQGPRPASKLDEEDEPGPPVNELKRPSN